MSLLAEEIVEEWLNRAGYFTIRGVKVGVHEIDLLAVRPVGKDRVERRHIEVQVSFRPVSYITQVPKNVQKTARRGPANAKRRSEAELRDSVSEWIKKKYELPPKMRLMRKLFPGDWTRELVVHMVRHEEEILEIQRSGVKVHRLRDIVHEMLRGSAIVEAAISGDFVDLVTLLNGRSGADP
jgi:hypothetical protein